MLNHPESMTSCSLIFPVFAPRFAAKLFQKSSSKICQGSTSSNRLGIMVFYLLLRDHTISFTRESGVVFQAKQQCSHSLVIKRLNENNLCMAQVLSPSSLYSPTILIFHYLQHLAILLTVTQTIHHVLVMANKIMALLDYLHV